MNSYKQQYATSTTLASETCSVKAFSLSSMLPNVQYQGREVVADE